MEKNKLIKLVENFKGKKIGVIGDLMLDQFVWGDVERISPEAPVPIVLNKKESFVPGGAGNTANNIVALGGKAFLIGTVGKDGAGDTLVKLFKKQRIDTSGIVGCQDRPTIQKIRIVARGQQLLRIDKESSHPVRQTTEKRLIEFIATQIKNWDVVVVSDYAKGVITKDLTQKVIKLATKYRKPIIGDTKPRNSSYFKNATLLTPNYKEASEIAGEENVKKIGKIIQAKLKCDILLTQGSEGMTLFHGNKMRHFPTKAQEVFDIAGAGDTVVAVVALSLAAGATLEKAAIISNHAAGVVVGKIGVATVSLEELNRSLKNG